MPNDDALTGDSESGAGSDESTTHVAGAGALTGIQPRIGPYLLVRKLAEGGMASVFLAKRADREYKKLVAIKLIRAGFDSPESVRRFQQERQILAAFDHPNIARLLDGGTTADGMPYIVMEYIEGETIDRYCQQRRLSVKERLRLFVQVCDAVQAAHAHLVIHRDIKPSNIIVTQDGVLKLLDFGTAKLLSPAGGVDGMTVTLEHAMTPLYASPEQISGHAISTASDIYSLGVLLHELLTGRHPYRLSSNADLAEIARAVGEQEPARPSITVPALKGDVDSIVLRALSKRPESRYPSAEAFARDVRNYLDGLPVRARSAAWPYRAARFVVRHRWGAAAAGAFLAIVIGASITLAVQSVRIERERDKTQQLADFLIGLFQLSGPERARGKTITAREILDRGADKIARDHSTAPDVRAAFMLTMADVYQQLGLYDQALPLAEQSLELRERAMGPDDSDSIRASATLGTILWRTGDVKGAERVYGEALARHRKWFRTDRQIEVRLLTGLSNVLYNKGDYKASRSAAEEALAVQRQYPGTDPAALPSTIFTVATAVHASGDLERAEPLYREAIELFRRAGIGSIDFSRARFNFAALLKDRGQYQESIPLYREGLIDYRRMLGDEHPEVARNVNNLAVSLMELGHYAAAEAAGREAVAIYRKALTAGHPDLEPSLATLADVLNANSRFVEAEELIREALAILEKSGKTNHPYALLDLTTLGIAVQGQGRSDEAERTFRRAHALYKTLPAGNEDVTAVLVALGSLLTERGHATEADPLLQEALEKRAKRFPAGGWRRAEVESAIGASLALQRRYDEAEKLLVEASRILVARSQTTRESQLAVQRTVRLYEALGKPDQVQRYQRMLPPGAIRSR